jgi:hypothetical protein
VNPSPEHVPGSQIVLIQFLHAEGLPLASRSASSALKITCEFSIMLGEHYLTRRAAIALLGAGASACMTRQIGPGPAALDEVVRRNTLARGGAAALDRMRSIAVDVEIIEAGQTLNGHYAASTNGLVRIDVYAGGNLVGAEGIDAQGVWILGSDGPQPSVATGAANALLHGAHNHLFGWHRFGELGHILALMPPSTLDGVTHHVVEIRYSTGHVSYFYVDPVTSQAVRRRDERAYHPDVSSTRQRVESRSMDFQSVDGVIAAHRNEDYDLDSGRLLSVNRVLSRRINPPLAANHFDRTRSASATW